MRVAIFTRVLSAGASLEDTPLGVLFEAAAATTVVLNSLPYLTRRVRALPLCLSHCAALPLCCLLWLAKPSIRHPRGTIHYNQNHARKTLQIKFL